MELRILNRAKGHRFATFSELESRKRLLVVSMMGAQSCQQYDFAGSTQAVLEYSSELARSIRNELLRSILFGMYG